MAVNKNNDRLTVLDRRLYLLNRLRYCEITLGNRHVRQLICCKRILKVCRVCWCIIIYACSSLAYCSDLLSISTTRRQTIILQDHINRSWTAVLTLRTLTLELTHIRNCERAHHIDFEGK